MNVTLRWAQSHIGQILIVSDKIYLYKEQICLESDFPAIVLDIDGIGDLARSQASAAATAAAAAEAAAEAVAFAVANGEANGEGARVELLYPDGSIRWTWITVDTYGFKDSLKEVI